MNVKKIAKNILSRTDTDESNAGPLYISRKETADGVPHAENRTACGGELDSVPAAEERELLKRGSAGDSNGAYISDYLERTMDSSSDEGSSSASATTPETF